MAVLKHPARHYVYYLYSRRTLRIADVIESLKEMGLPAPYEQKPIEAFTRQSMSVRRAMDFPVTFNPTSKTPSQGTLDFLARWGITDAWRDNTYLGPATEILFAPAIRHMLELLTLGPMSNISIANRVADRFQLPSHAMNAGVVRAYKHYFWDFSSMTLGEWRQFISEHYPANSVDFLSVLQAPRNRAGAAFVLSVVDKEPRLIGAQERYEMVSSMAFRRFMAHALSDTDSGSTYAAFTALNMMKVADEELSKHRGGSVELLEQLQRMSVVYDEKQPRTFQELSFVKPLVIDTKGEEVTNE